MSDRRAALIAYLKSCVEVADWHGVRDAAVDLEVLEGRQSINDDARVPLRDLPPFTTLAAAEDRRLK